MANKSNDNPIHPGPNIKRMILQKGLTVNKASERLNVSRPALSNLLNGKAALSPEMALKIEEVFHCESTKLLQMQTKYDAFKAHKNNDGFIVRPYVNPFFHICASEISDWSREISAREQLPALLRTLIHSTGTSLVKVDFPAYSNAQRKGWDGKVTSDRVSPWIPLGKSGWEFGCSKKPKEKATKDFNARTKSVPNEDKSEMTFVFVTPKNWEEKEDWSEEKRNLGIWKDVRAIDASDLEQWLEQSIQAQIKMYEFMGQDCEGMATLDHMWSKWAEVTEPKLPKELFDSAVKRHHDNLQDWLETPPDRPFIVTADSIMEGVAFLRCALEKIGDSLPGAYERTIVVGSVKGLSPRTGTRSNAIVIVDSSEIEQNLAGFHRKNHTIIVRGNYMINRDKKDVVLDKLGYDSFRNALRSVGLDNHRIDQLSRKSARSPTILRRQLAVVPEVKMPAWTKDERVVQSLIPFVLVGTWNSRNENDKEILKYITDNTDYNKIERIVTNLRAQEESPVWSISNCHGVFSKIDAFFSIQNRITQDDIDKFLFVAKLVLSEDDPALELPEEKRWAAELYGKIRNYSDEIRKGICDSLVMLAVHGNELEYNNIYSDVEHEISKIVSTILNQANSKFSWKSHRNELPHYAEMAPDIFLNIIEDDLDCEHPKIAELFEPSKSVIFGECYRLGILWALEKLAWNPDLLPRVVNVLARLYEWKIDDNWGHSPILTLKSIFCYWMPQTSASLKVRNNVLEKLCQKYPEVGWQVCIDQFNPYPRIGPLNSRPNWRTYALDAGEVVSKNELRRCQAKAIEIALNWPELNEYSLSDLIKRVSLLRQDHRYHLWKRIIIWNNTGPSDEQKAFLHEQIRQVLLTRKSRTDNKINDFTSKKALQILDILKPANPVEIHKWLFLQHWVEENEEDIEEDHFDYSKREERVEGKRRDALQEIWNFSGILGIKELCRGGETSFTIGYLLAEICDEGLQSNEILINLLEENSNDMWMKYSQCIAGFLSGLGTNVRIEVLEQLLNQPNTDDKTRVDLLTCAPFDKDTWIQVDRQQLNQQYWEEVTPRYNYKDSSLNLIAVEELIKANRPRAAFSTIHRHFEEFDTSLLVRLLTEVATNNKEPSNFYRIDNYYVSDALKTLDERSDVTSEELSRLEFYFVNILDHTGYKIKHLEIQLSNSPELFLEAIIFAFKRSDDQVDPEEWNLSGKQNKENVALIYYGLLQKAKRIPGTLKDGSIDLEKLKDWILKVRVLAREYGRIAICDQMIGQLLSNCPSDDNGVWPCKSVREALEEIKSREIALGIEIGIINSVGPQWRSEQDDLERKYAEQYRNWYQKIIFDYPFTARMLKSIAESYDRDAQWWEQKKSLTTRLDHYFVY